MPLFIANQSSTGGEVQMTAGEWLLASRLLSGRPRAGMLPRKIELEIDGQPADTVRRIRLTNDEIERVDRALTGR